MRCASCRAAHRLRRFLNCRTPRKGILRMRWLPFMKQTAGWRRTPAVPIPFPRPPLSRLRRTHQLQQIDDLYLPGRALQLQEERVTLHTMPPLTPFATEASETVQTAQHVSHVVAASACCCGAKRDADGALQITAAVQVLYLSDDQQLYVMQRLLPLTMPCAVPGDLTQIELSARASSAGESDMLLTVVSRWYGSARRTAGISPYHGS